MREVTEAREEAEEATSDLNKSELEREVTIGEAGREEE